MSALAYIFAFLQFALFNPIGIFCFLLGVLMFLGMPVVPAVTNRLHALARLHLWTATRMLKRAAFVITPQGDLLCKRLSPDDAGTELIEFNDTTKEFEDPTNALHWWYGIPFALADEVHGVLFDPRHAAVAMREKMLRDRDRHECPATESEQESHNVIGWQHGVYEFARNAYELVDLGAIRYLMMGSERAEHPDRVKTFYENSRIPYESGTSTARWIMLVVAIVGPFTAIWVLASQLGTPGGPDSTVSFGSLALLLSSAGMLSEDVRDRLKTVAVGSAVVVPLVGLFALLFLFVSPILAVFVYLLLGAGFWFIPIICLLFGRLSTTFADGASGLLFRLGFVGYDEPIFEWTPQQYRVRELSRMNNADESQAAWYGFAGQLVGFTFEPGPESWPRGVVENKELENKRADPVDPATNVPSGLQIWDGQTRDRYGALIPKRIRDSCYYLYSGIILEQFAYAATGEKSAERLTQAKDEFGDGTGMAEGRFGTLMLVGGLVSFAAGIGVFFL